MRIFLADPGHNQITKNTDSYPLGIANLATYLGAYLKTDSKPEISIFREPEDLKAALDQDPHFDALGALKARAALAELQ